MTWNRKAILPLFFATLGFGMPASGHAQQLVAISQPPVAIATASVASGETALPDAPVPQATPAQSPATATTDAAKDKYAEGKQSSRIFFIIPNFRAVSVDEKLPVLSRKEKVVLAVDDSFDYSSFIYVGLLAGVQDLNRSTPEFQHGGAAYGRYYWHAFADNTDGNLMTEAVYPILTHEDPRYYTLGRGGFRRRLGYSLGRLFVTRSDTGNKTFNISEIAGNATAAAISNAYYPAQERTATKTIENWWLQISLDGASNVLKEFWPDIAHALFHQAAPPPGT